MLAFFGFGTVLFVFWVVLYFLPTIVALMRKPNNKTAVVVINIFLGWTLIGWVVAMCMAVWNKNPIQVQHVNLPPRDN